VSARRAADRERRAAPRSRRTASRVRRAVARVRRANRREAAPEAGAARLWAPWRMAWLENAPRSSGCLFCRVAAAGADRRDLVLARLPHALLMLNRYPYASGHLMAAVTRHAGAFGALTPAEREDLLEMIALGERALGAAVRPHGLNLGANLGRVAGAGFPGHLHVHLVPRWEGDTNFMPVTAGTRVLPETLADTWTRLRRTIAALERPARRERAGGKGRRAPA